MKLDPIVKRRLQALLIDYGLILLYLIALALVFSLIYGLVIGQIPLFNHATSHLISFLTTVLPVVLVLAWLESHEGQASPGKKRMKLKVNYQEKSYFKAVLRNAVKFLPWQVGHTGVIAAIYNDYSVAWFMLANSAVLLALILLAMVVYRSDHRHLGDMLAKARIVAIEKS